MAITKAKISELVQDIITGSSYSDQQKFHSSIIEEVAESIRNAMIGEAYRFEKRKGTSELPGDFFKMFWGVEVKRDGNRYPYAELPSRLISLPNDKGLDGVMKEKGDEAEFNIIKPGSVQTFNRLDVGIVDDQNDVYVENDTLYFPNIDQDTEKVKVRMIPAINDLDEDDVIPIPANFEEQFVQRIIQNLQEQKYTPQDTTTDGSEAEIRGGGTE